MLILFPTYTLLFSSPTSGSIGSGIHIPSGGTSADARDLGFSGTSASFSISERTALEAGPVLNVSLRGTVDPIALLSQGLWSQVAIPETFSYEPLALL
jgi:hypothetical protein